MLATIFGKDYRWWLAGVPPVLPVLPDERFVEALSEIFENPEHFFEELTPSAVDAGLDILSGPYGIVHSLCNDEISLPVRRRYVKAHIPLFLQYVLPKSRRDGYLYLSLISYWSSFVTFAAYSVQHLLDDPRGCG